jgi:hypothetical protein
MASGVTMFDPGSSAPTNAANTQQSELTQFLHAGTTVPAGVLAIANEVIEWPCCSLQCTSLFLARRVTYRNAAIR